LEKRWGKKGGKHFSKGEDVFFKKERQQEKK
jgi:hypothetical protein